MTSLRHLFDMHHVEQISLCAKIRQRNSWRLMSWHRNVVPFFEPTANKRSMHLDLKRPSLRCWNLDFVIWYCLIRGNKVRRTTIKIINERNLPMAFKHLVIASLASEFFRVLKSISSMPISWSFTCKRPSLYAAPPCSTYKISVLAASTQATSKRSPYNCRTFQIAFIFFILRKDITVEVNVGWSLGNTFSTLFSNFRCVYRPSN